MRFNKTLKIENALSKDPTRPQLMAAWYDVENKTLTATDGHRLTRIAVTVDEGDHTGWITADAIKAARKAVPKRVDDAQILANGALVVPKGPTFARPSDEVKPPPFDQVIPDPYSETETTRKRSEFFGINPDYLADAMAAMGGKGIAIYQTGGNLDPVIVTPRPWKSQAEFEQLKRESITVVMPMRL